MNRQSGDGTDPGADAACEYTGQRDASAIAEVTAE